MLKTDYAQWIGKTQTVQGGVSLDLAETLAATLTPRAPHDISAQAPLPYLWHWAAFTPKAATHSLSADGHPARGDFLPPVPLPRRMWAGGAVTFHAPLRIGTALRQVSTIVDVQEKSDTMVFVSVAHDVFDGDTLCLSETQNIVYLEIPTAYTPPKPVPVPAAQDFAIAQPMSEALLFRYSAATFNAHRIHYDLPYAQDVEKYPGLVVHGPLQATLLLDAAVAWAKQAPKTFTYRGIHPLFHHDPLHLIGHAATPAGMSLCTGVPGQHQGQTAKVTWTETV